MDTLMSIGIGWFFGFFFGVGCSLVVFYAIYLGAYGKAIADSLLVPLPENYTRLRAKAEVARISIAVPQEIDMSTGQIR